VQSLAGAGFPCRCDAFTRLGRVAAIAPCFANKISNDTDAERAIDTRADNRGAAGWCGVGPAAGASRPGRADAGKTGSSGSFGPSRARLKASAIDAH